MLKLHFSFFHVKCVPQENQVHVFIFFPSRLIYLKILLYQSTIRYMWESRQFCVLYALISCFSFHIYLLELYVLGIQDLGVQISKSLLKSSK